MKNTIFTGAGVAIITPMNADGSINYDGFAENIEFQIANGTDAIIVCGTTGEASTMTDDEHIECIRFAVEKTAGRIPVIAGTGSNDTKYAVELSKIAQEKGADGSGRMDYENLFLKIICLTNKESGLKLNIQRLATVLSRW